MLQRTNKKLVDEIISRMESTKENWNEKPRKVKKGTKRSKKKGTIYFNNPIAFDVESTSFYINGEKYSLCYMWQMKIENVCIYGRRLFEFSYTINRIADALKCAYRVKHIVIYIHFLGFEFQWIRKYFDWANDAILCNKTRGVIQAITKNGIEFRCSASLSGMRLETLAKELTTKRMRKSKDLDYDLLRHSGTILTRKEMKYCELDVKILWQYIHEKLLYHKKIYEIPLTKTGYPRTELKKRYSGQGTNAEDYRNMMKDLKMTESEYKENKRAFMGGFTFASMHARQQTLKNVISYDINSDYPYQMVVGYYPVSNGTEIIRPTYEQVKEAIRTKCCIMDVSFRNIRTDNPYVLYLMKHKIRVREEDKHKCVYAWGRLVKGMCEVNTTITELDWHIINKIYRYDDICFYKIITYEREKLPREMILALLEWYKNKTELKGVKGKELLYTTEKQKVNSNFGIHVTDPCKLRDSYNNIAEKWDTRIGEGKECETLEEYIKKKLDEYNEKRSEKIVWYPIGIYITAHARKTLFDAILSMRNLYVYSDTDSMKLRQSKSGVEELIIQEHNLQSIKKLEEACKYYQIPFSMCAPKNHILGQWELDGQYKIFKTLGAKRYMYLPYGKDEPKIKLTEEEFEELLNRKPKASDHLKTVVAGTSPDELPKKFIKECKTYREVFDRFDFGLHIEEEYTKKMTHTYIDEVQKGVIKDYRGKEGEFYTPSGIHLEPTGYDIKTQADTDLDIVAENIGDFDSMMDDDTIT